MSAIITIETLPEAQAVIALIPLPTWAWTAALCSRYGKGAPPRIFLASQKVTAYINHSRWVADCPECLSGAMVVSRFDSFFWCPSCGSPVAGWRRVVFPSDADQIEHLLSKRAHARNRNWRPGESLEYLDQENVAHGVGGVF